MKTTTATGPVFPLVVNKNGVSAKIYKTTSVKNGVEYSAFIVDYFLGGRRKKVSRSTLEAAKTVANDACVKISNGESDALNLTGRDRFELLRAREALAPSGKPVDVACQEYAQMLLLSGNASLLEIIHDWQRRNDGTERNKISVPDAINKMILELSSDGMTSAGHQKNITIALNAFSDAFQTGVQMVASDQVDRHLAGLPLAARSKANRRDAIGTFNRWLILKKYLPRDADWLFGVRKYSRQKVGEIEIYSPGEMRRLLPKAGDMTPFVAIAAFAGIRHATINRLVWDEIKLDEGYIFVPGKKGKNKTSYLVPIHDNLKKWLAPWHKKHAPVITKPAEYQDLNVYTAKRLVAIAEAAGVPMKRNGLRHSFVSYRLAETHDFGKVAEESNNSPAKIVSNYKQPVKPAAAAEWFAIEPA